MTESALLRQDSHKNEIQDEILSCLKGKPAHAHYVEWSRKDIQETLSKKEIHCSNGTFYNIMSKLMGENLVFSRRSTCAFYRINQAIEAKNEIHPMGVLESGHIVGRDGFVSSVLELARANGFDAVSRVHDVHLHSYLWDVSGFLWARKHKGLVWFGEDCFKWRRNRQAKSWVLKLFADGYKVTFQVFESGVLSAVVKCAKNPIPVALSGLSQLRGVLEKAALIVFGREKCFPDFDKWTVSFWHYGKDSKRVFDCQFNVLFQDFFGGLQRIYVREEDGRLRVEDFQNPKVTLGVLQSEAERLQSEWVAMEREKQIVLQEQAKAFAPFAESIFKGLVKRYVQESCLASSDSGDSGFIASGPC
jgi:hypothetical protein